ncbi:MAG: PilZ domain-containing protein, partial [Bdellovibrionota bacterium]
ASLTRALEGLEMSDDSGPLSATQSAPPPISFASAPMTAPKPAPAAAAFSLELGESASISAPESAPAAEVFSLDMGSSAPAYPPPMSFEISAPAPMPVSSPVSPPVFAPTVSPVSAPAAAAELSISFDMENPEVDREDPTMSFSALGLSLENVDVPPPKAEPPAGLAVPPVARPSVPPQPNSSPPPKPAASPAVPPPRVSLNTLAEKDTGTFDGITAQVPMDPIWLVKRGNLETVAGPFRFLEVIKLLEEGKLNKNDKISREGTNRFVKIQQQYEFNVKFVVETVVESGVERQRIVIKRRHPRVSYMTEVQIAAKGGNYVAACVNISAGGILIEMSKGEFALGEIIDIKMMPSLISKMIACKSMVIGKIPKIPPGFALKFENLKPEDKEAIEFFVNESLKREMQKNS